MTILLWAYLCVAIFVLPLARAWLSWHRGWKLHLYSLFIGLGWFPVIVIMSVNYTGVMFYRRKRKRSTYIKPLKINIEKGMSV